MTSGAAWVSFLRWTLALSGVGVFVWRGVWAVYWFRLWLRERLIDRSAAELYEVNWWIEAVIAAIGLGVAVAGFRLLRPRRGGSPAH